MQLVEHALTSSGTTSVAMLSEIHRRTTCVPIGDWQSPVDMELAWIDIQSQDGVFGRGPVQNLGGPFDDVTLDNLFKATLDGSFGSMTFGHVARTRLSEEFLHTDLSVAGMLANGAGVGAVDLVYVPHSGAGLTTIFYDPNTGHIWVVPPAGFEFTSVNIGGS